MTERILEIFGGICEIPHCSKDEQRLVEHIAQWAEKSGFDYKRDRVGNLLIHIPASEGFEDAPIVVIQGHMDMVCEKNDDVCHDFTKDPIIPVVNDDGWLTAQGTSLGADNGIAIAFGIALAESKNIPHPPLELLFTVDEEIGLVGAFSLEPGFVTGRILINIDSEEEGIFTLGCAGGRETHVLLDVTREAQKGSFDQYILCVDGLSGGHSGINIGTGRANAIHILARLLKAVPVQSILSLNGGSAHNAIPRSARAEILLPAGQDWSIDIEGLASRIAKEYHPVENGIKIEFRNAASGDCDGVSIADTRRIIDLLLALPHGVFDMSRAVPGMVETSNNLAKADLSESSLEILLSQRSTTRSSLDFLTEKVEAVGRLAGADCESNTGYPSWKPNMDSRLLEIALNTYRACCGRDAETMTIHAGLECGIIGDKYPGMDMISIGPDLLYPHSPDERVNIASIGRTWDFLVALLTDIKEY